MKAAFGRKWKEEMAKKWPSIIWYTMFFLISTSCGFSWVFVRLISLQQPIFVYWWILSWIAIMAFRMTVDILYSGVTAQRFFSPFYHSCRCSDAGVPFAAAILLVRSGSED